MWNLAKSRPGSSARLASSAASDRAKEKASFSVMAALAAATTSRTAAASSWRRESQVCTSRPSLRTVLALLGTGVRAVARASAAVLGAMPRGTAVLLAVVLRGTVVVLLGTGMPLGGTAVLLAGTGVPLNGTGVLLEGTAVAALAGDAEALGESARGAAKGSSALTLASSFTRASALASSENLLPRRCLHHVASAAQMAARAPTAQSCLLIHQGGCTSLRAHGSPDRTVRAFRSL
mmetsp:Transcript_76470/g.177469  ORF Transcript_76470/g.177469 Transcript_76470/m.177469 type:complete len:235 (+) Transcript_76470:729-1433(+)